MAKKSKIPDVVTPSDVLRIETVKGKHVWIYNDDVVSAEMVKVLKAEAETISNTNLFKMLVNEGKYHAQRRAIIETDIDDDAKSLAILRKAQAFHKVVLLFETFIMNIKNK